MAQFKRHLVKIPSIALSFGIRKFILATFGSVKIVKQMCQFFVNIPVHKHISSNIVVSTWILLLGLLWEYAMHFFTNCIGKSGRLTQGDSPGSLNRLRLVGMYFWG